MDSVDVEEFNLCQTLIPYMLGQCYNLEDPKNCFLYTIKRFETLFSTNTAIRSTNYKKLINQCINFDRFAVVISYIKEEQRTQLLIVKLGAKCYLFSPERSILNKDNQFMKLMLESFAYKKQVLYHGYELSSYMDALKLSLKIMTEYRENNPRAYEKRSRLSTYNESWVPELQKACLSSVDELIELKEIFAEYEKKIKIGNKEMQEIDLYKSMREQVTKKETEYEKLSYTLRLSKAHQLASK